MKYTEIIWKYQISNEKIDEKNENSNECCSEENSEATKFKKTRQRTKYRVKTLIQNKEFKNQTTTKIQLAGTL